MLESNTNALLWSPKICLKTKMTIYKSNEEPVLRLLANDDERGKQLEVLKMDYIGKACRISRLDHIRRKTGGIHNTIGTIHSRQLIWYK